MVLHFSKRIQCLCSRFRQAFLEKRERQGDFVLENVNAIILHPYNKQYIIRYINTNLKIRLAIPNEKQLYFISVFIYTSIKVKLTKGRKRDSFAKTKPNQTYRLSLLAAKYEQSKYEDWAKYNSKQSNTHLLPDHKKTTRKSVNLPSILQPESAKLSLICLIFAKRRFRSKREPFFSFSLRLKIN